MSVNLKDYFVVKTAKRNLVLSETQSTKMSAWTILILYTLTDKVQFSRLAILAFKLTNITYVIQITIQTGSKIIFPSPLTTIHIFSKIKFQIGPL